MKRFQFCIVVFCLLPWWLGCDRFLETSARVKSASPEEETSATPEEQKYLDAVKPFVDALVARNYEQAFSFLSSHAKARLSPNQFVPPEDDDQFKRGEANAVVNATAQDFSSLMAKVERWHGTPQQVKHLHVQSLDPEVLKGRGDRLEVMFSIGAMPASIPNLIRRASIRGQLGVKLSEAQLRQAARDARLTVEELQKQTEFEPYLNVKVVLVEEMGELRVGYFEFLPPSMLD